MGEEVVYILKVLIIAAIASSLLMYIKNVFDKLRTTREQQEVRKEVDRIIKTFEEPQDALTMMRRNVAELHEYYVINKQHARSSFSSALFVCFLGFIVFAAGIVISYLTPGQKSVIAYSTIAGAIVEIIAGLFFWLYSQAIKQINIFHDQLTETQQFLTAIQIVSNIAKRKRDDVYAYIVQHLVGGKKSVDLKELKKYRAKTAKKE